MGECTNIPQSEDEKRDLNELAMFIVQLNGLKLKYKAQTPKYQKLFYNAGLLIDKINAYLIEKK